MCNLQLYLESSLLTCGQGRPAEGELEPYPLLVSDNEHPKTVPVYTTVKHA